MSRGNRAIKNGIKSGALKHIQNFHAYGLSTAVFKVGDKAKKDKVGRAGHKYLRMNIIEYEFLRMNIISRFPKHITRFSVDSVTEEMSLKVIELELSKFLDYCVCTEATVKLACEKQLDIFHHWCPDNRKAQYEKLCEMFLHSDKIRPFAAHYLSYIFENIKELNFKNCAALIETCRECGLDGSTPPLEYTLSKAHWCEYKLQKNWWSVLQTRHFLLHWCFKRACFFVVRNKKSLRPEWRENVRALGQMERFDEETRILVWSFMLK